MAKGKILPVDADYKMRKDVEGLFVRTKGTLNRLNELKGTIGAETKEVLDAHNLNKTALGFIARMDRMSETKRADTLATLDKVLPLIRQTWAENGTPDMLGKGDDDVSEKPDADAGAA